MALEIEAVGDMLTAGLVAEALEDDGAGHGKAAHACANCATPLTGKYCSNCGQTAHVHRSVLHLVEELAHGIFHFDTKGWRTIPMLAIHPGKLTRRYIDGQRARFVSPLALFLFMVFLMFLTFSMTSNFHLNKSPEEVAKSRAEGRVSFTERVAEREEAFKEAQAALESAKASGIDLDSAQKALEKAKERQAKAVAQLAEYDDGSSKLDIKLKDKLTSKADGTAKVHSDIPWLNEALQHAKDNPDLALYKLKGAASKYSFLIVPISMPFLWLMFFWRRDVKMYDHAVFSLYSLSFMATLFILVAIAGYFDHGGIAASLAVFVPPVHMYVHLKGTYGLGRWGAFWRTCTMLIVASLVLSIYAVTILALSVA